MKGVYLSDSELYVHFGWELKVEERDWGVTELVVVY